MAEHEMGVAASHLGAKEPSVGHKGHKPMKEFHVRQLHDGSYHVMMHHGRDQHGMETKPPTEASSPDLYGTHVHLEDHMGTPEGHGKGEKGGETKNAHFEDGEHEGEKKQGREEKPSTKGGKDTSEKDEHAADEEMEEK